MGFRNPNASRRSGSLEHVVNMAAPFQQRHFERMAEIISELPPGTREQVSEHFTDRIARSHPNFKPERFLKACKP